MNLNYIEYDDMETAELVPEYLDRISAIISRNGPSESEYKFISNATLDLMNLSLEDQSKLHSVLEPILQMNTMIGFTFQKPHGYAGDFELIHRIYTNWKTDNESHKKWDALYHWADSANAVRNRKNYLIKQVSKVTEKKEKPLILNLGSGPCTDIYEYYNKFPKSSATFDCIDMDSKSIEFASAVCDNYMDSISFINKNVFRFNNNKKYDLIWSAGLFDYFNDKLFVRLINRYYAHLAIDGELVIGNFSKENPSRGLMEVLCQWYLHHRSKEELFQLAEKAGIPKDKINIQSEPTGINLFLHINK